MQSPPKICHCTLVNSHLPIPPFLVYKIMLTTSTNTQAHNIWYIAGNEDDEDL